MSFCLSAFGFSCLSSLSSLFFQSPSGYVSGAAVIRTPRPCLNGVGFSDRCQSQMLIISVLISRHYSYGHYLHLLCPPVCDGLASGCPSTPLFAARGKGAGRPSHICLSKP